MEQELLDFIEAWTIMELSTCIAILGVCVAVLVTFCAVYRWVYNQYKRRLLTVKSRNNIHAELERRDDWFSPYSTLLDVVLKKSSSFFGTPFSDRAFERCLLFAFFYLLIPLLVVWGVTGTGINGIEGFFVDGIVWWQRVLVVLLLAVAVLTGYRLFTHNRQSKWWLIFAFALVSAFSLALILSLSLSLSLSLALILSLSLSLSLSLASVFAGTLSLVGVVIAVFVIALFLSSIVAFAGASTFTIAFSVTCAGVVAFAFATFFTAAFAIQR